MDDTDLLSILISLETIANTITKYWGFPYKKCTTNNDGLDRGPWSLDPLWVTPLLAKQVGKVQHIAAKASLFFSDSWVMGLLFLHHFMYNHTFPVWKPQFWGYSTEEEEDFDVYSLPTPSSKIHVCKANPWSLVMVEQ